MDSEILLNSWIAEINERGGLFLQSYLEEIKSVELNVKEQLLLVSLAIKAIEADNRIEYSEVKFFKKYVQDLQLATKQYWLSIQIKKTSYCLILILRSCLNGTTIYCSHKYQFLHGLIKQFQKCAKPIVWSWRTFSVCYLQFRIALVLTNLVYLNNNFTVRSLY